VNHALPQPKRRRSAPTVRRRHKMMGGISPLAFEAKVA
jgi:hypothetical protein